MSSTTMSLASITKKTIMALAGLFLIVFLVIHMGINLFLMPITENHVEIFKEAAEFMGTNPLIKFMEIFLMAAFLLHIVYGVIVQIQNWRARGHRYAVAQKTKTSFLSRYMIYTGILIFLFLGLHFYQFYFIKLGLVVRPDGLGEHDFYKIAVELFQNDLMYNIIYVVSFVFLAFHMNHAFQSAFQTLGLNHPKYMPWIKGFGTLYSIILGVGFTSIPVYFYFFH
ncbi:MAG: succinate dehydrogenase cytochrome b subunit [Bacteroidales bacterium]|nr:succinate dehydrogenase cytochrome b subunit [Bacteroidales bacterium]